MRAAGLSINGLAAATRTLDPTGKGVKPATIGFMVSQGKSGRDGIGDDAGQLLARALGAPVEVLFESDDEFCSVTESTSTPGEQIMSASAEPWVSTEQLADHLGKSPNWVRAMRRQYPKGQPNAFPWRPVGRTPRYQRSAVEAWLDEVFGAVAA